MDNLLELFEKSLAEYQGSIGKKDNLVGCGEIIVKEFRKMRENNVTLGQLLADFYAQERQEHRRVVTMTPSECTAQLYREQSRNQGPAQSISDERTIHEHNYAMVRQIILCQFVPCRNRWGWRHCSVVGNAVCHTPPPLSDDRGNHVF